LTTGKQFFFTLLPKSTKVSVAETLATYSEEVRATFVAVGTVQLASDKSAGGVSVATALCDLTECSVIVSHFTGGEYDLLLQEKKVERMKKREEKPKISRVDSYRLKRETEYADEEGEEKKEAEKKEAEKKEAE
jgi:hypothetical protein